ncbi:uncharacterized protein MONBRDRAFT_30415 [Monosiga brevicollis MX1]|uniref:Uncharacterized protein n=1 Tax=Monosiga brevicollis TaxID=81824 RepID=A9VDW5_MONBE|nr:uncharacterized protein MONBRDRAFT_30415 [Monosiga brevicollis MX1]EDQ84274.1 predicted protein [Monosiga brevicollis MX1]|eukprot:XP_001750904.1 hypothetical protein [Monosiga brevicollis MX1]
MDKHLAPFDPASYTRLDLQQPSLDAIPPYARGRVYNRYNDILPSPASRVILPEERGDPATTYINANYLPFLGNPKAYIAAMGPLPTTIHSFLRMVIEHKTVAMVCPRSPPPQSVSAIHCPPNMRRLPCLTMFTRQVMTTNFEEKGRKKCECYWPELPQDTMEFGDIKVFNEGQQQEQFFRITRLRLERGGTIHRVTHFFYNTWPDRGVPRSDDNVMLTRGVVKMLAAVRRHRIQTDKATSPLLVHCSAGVGRTGCFVLIDQCFRLLEHNQRLDLAALIKENRRYRMAFVQTPEQFEFAWRTVAGYINFRLKTMAQAQATPSSTSSSQAPVPAARASPAPVPAAEPSPPTSPREPKEGDVLITTEAYSNPDGHDDTLSFQAGMRCILMEKSEHWWRVSMRNQDGWVLPSLLRPVGTTPVPSSGSTAAPASAKPTTKTPSAQTNTQEAAPDLFATKSTPAAEEPPTKQAALGGHDSQSGSRALSAATSASSLRSTTSPFDNPFGKEPRAAGTASPTPMQNPFSAKAGNFRRPTRSSSSSTTGGVITKNPFLASMKVKPGQKLQARPELSSSAKSSVATDATTASSMDTAPPRDDADEDEVFDDPDPAPVASPVKQQGVLEQERPLTFEEIMDRATRMDENGDELPPSDDEPETEVKKPDGVAAAVARDQPVVPTQRAPAAETTMPVSSVEKAPRPKEAYQSDLPAWTYVDEHGELRRLADLAPAYKHEFSLDQARLRHFSEIEGPAIVSHNQEWIELATGLPARALVSEA